MRPSHSVLMPLLFAFVAAALCDSPLRADELRLSDTFTDNAVLQRWVPLPVWGTTKANTAVTIEFAGQSKTATSAKDGTWRINLTPMHASHTGRTMTVKSDGSVQELHNLLVGEVWYASGQSNMQMTLTSCSRKIPAIKEMVDAAPTNHIRFLRISAPDSPQPLTTRHQVSAWQCDNPVNRAKQSAVAYLFAHTLQERLNVPVGIIEGSWGGKPIEGFIPRSQFTITKPLQKILSLAENDQLDEVAKLKGGVIIRNTAGMPGRIYNSRVAPIAPFAIRGFIWYQGESNAGRGEDPRNYRIKMKALIDGWRQTWGQPELPFYFVQLPAFSDTAHGWVRLREEQRLSLSIPHTGMAVTIDLRDSDIHPANKLDVAKRLANWALVKTYGKQLVHSGPLFKSATINNDTVRVKFDHAETGLLVARKEGIASPKATPETALSHFELADNTGQWYPARATIDGSQVVVQSSKVMRPRAVRYACSGNPANANLYNQAGLPASPFCSELNLLGWQLEKAR